MEEFGLKVIARVHSDFPTKFGIPRQSGLVDSLNATIVFEPEYRDENALRGLEGFSHIWLIWQFSGNLRDGWSPTVRPPRLGGNERVGVFATRSPFRPNPLGLSCVKLERIEYNTPQGPVLHVSGADLMDTTPIFDIKPYIPYADAHPEAKAGFASEAPKEKLKVVLPPELEMLLPPDKTAPLIGVLEQNPCPRYQNSPDRVYGMEFAGFDVRFTVNGDTLTVTEINKL